MSENEVYISLVDQIKLKDEEILYLKKRLDQKTKNVFWKKQLLKIYEGIFFFVSLVIMTLEFSGILVARLDYQYHSWFDRHWLLMICSSLFFVVVPNILNFFIKTKENLYEHRTNKKNGRIFKYKK